MSTTSPYSPTNKKEYVKDIGKILVKNNGKKKYYKPEEIKKAHLDSCWVELIDPPLWALSLFSSHSDYNNFHELTAESSEYVEMKTEILSEISATPASDWTEISDMAIDASWLDFGDIFEGLFEGIGEFVAGVLEGLG